MSERVEQARAPSSLSLAFPRFAERLFDAFFAKATPFDLGVCRLIVFGYAFYHYLGFSYGWGAYESSLYRPVGIYTLIPLPSASVIAVMAAVAKLGALFAFLGIGYRPAAIATALTLPYLIGIGNNFGKINHSENLLATAILILAFARAGDGLSVSAWWRRRQGGDEPAPSGAYRWPVRAIWLVIAGMYFSAGIAKLLHSGWEWALSDSFQLTLLRHHFTHSPPTLIGVWLANHPALCQGVALGALALELLCPLLLLGGRWTLVFGGGLMALQAGIYVALGVLFHAMIPVFSILVPWEWLWHRLPLAVRRFAAGAETTGRRAPQENTDR